MSRIEATFSRLKEEKRKAFIPFITAGDPHYDASLDILLQLPEQGADLVELGMPFTDPMADGPAIQKAAQRALESGMNLKKVLEMAAAFRAKHADTPLILMGYYNPIYNFGADEFCKQAANAGVDGLLIVDLPPEEDRELRQPAQENGLDLIRLITPTTDEARLNIILSHSSGFLYYVSITGVTGTKKADFSKVAKHMDMIQNHTDIPLAVGFGIRTPDDVRAIPARAQAVVVGSAIVDGLEAVNNNAKPMDELLADIKALADAAHETA